MTSPIAEEYYQEFLTSLLAGRHSECAQLVNAQLTAGMQVRDLYTDLFQRSLYEVGERWEHCQVSVATEHMATAIVERMLTIVQPHVFGGDVRTRTAIIACVADEYHQLGARMVADSFELNGWRGLFLGANTPLSDLLEMIGTHEPEVVGLSLSIYFNLPSLLSAVETVRREFPEQTIMVGGQAFRWGGADSLPDDPHVLRVFTLNDLERHVASYDVN